jgi:hypothetical protein
MERRRYFVDTSAKRIMFRGKVYTVGDDVVVTRDDDPQGTPWKAKIKEFIYHCTDEQISVHFSANYYKQQQTWNRTLRRYQDDIDELTGMNLVETDVFYPFDEKSIKPLRLIQHKFMKINVSRNRGIAYEMCRIKRRNTLTLFMFDNTLGSRIR